MKFRCPICKAPTDSKNPDFPFCSERCRQQDLANWAAGKYKVAAPNIDESEPDEAPVNEADSTDRGYDE